MIPYISSHTTWVSFHEAYTVTAVKSLLPLLGHVDVRVVPLVDGFPPGVEVLVAVDVVGLEAYPHVVGTDERAPRHVMATDASGNQMVARHVVALVDRHVVVRVFGLHLHELQVHLFARNVNEPDTVQIVRVAGRETRRRETPWTANPDASTTGSCETTRALQLEGERLNISLIYV